MRPKNIAYACLVVVCLTACSPALNWRETPIDASSLVSLFPCKPQKSSRVVALAGKDVELFMASCEAAGVTAAVGHARIQDPTLVGPVLLQWRAATLNGMRAKTSFVSSFALERATPMPQSVQVQASGRGADGRALDLRAAWFAQGKEVFVALLYAETLGPDVTDPFFSGLKFR